MTETRTALEFTDHSVAFGASTITSGVHLRLVPGRILALVGESGSGKSVTALASIGLAGSNATQSGSVRLGEVELVGMDAEELRTVRGSRIGVVFQEPAGAFNPMYRVGQQIAEAVRAHTGHHRPRSGSDPSVSTPPSTAAASSDTAAVRSGAASAGSMGVTSAGNGSDTGPAGSGATPAAGRSVEGRVLEQLRAVGLPEPERVFSSYPHQLSGGQLQRAMIALATINSPEVLIADEPTTALDVTVQTGILDLLRRQATEAGQAVLLITHDMGVVADIADDVAVMQHGRIVETGTAAQIFSAPAEAYTKQLLAAVPRLGSSLAGGGLVGSSVSTTTQPDVPAAEVREAVVIHKGRNRLTALDHVSISIPQGTITGLVGESGSGKSTIANVLTGGQALSSGSAHILGTEVSTKSTRAQRALRSRIGVVFQDPRGSLNPRRTVGTQIGEPLRVHRKVHGTVLDERVAALLTSVQLPTDFAQRYPHELSGGQRQRIAIARALALDPELIIADEPTSALDVSVQRGVLELLAQLHEEYGFACLFISHDLAVVEQLADHVTVLEHGVIVEQGTAAEVLGNPQEPYTKRLIESAPVPDPEVQAAKRAARQTA